MTWAKRVRNQQDREAFFKETADNWAHYVPAEFTKDDVFARKAMSEFYDEGNGWREERLFGPDIVIANWRRLVSREARGIQPSKRPGLAIDLRPRSSDPVSVSVTDHFSIAEARDLLVQMVGINSSTGHEIELVEFLDRWCRASGLSTKMDRGPGRAGSLVIELPGERPLESPTVLFYAPLDTAESVDLSRDVPWFGSLQAVNAWREVKVRGDEVAGVGAENPKGFALATLMAIVAIKRSGTKLNGTVRVALCGSAMPTLGVDPSELGLGSGLLPLAATWTRGRLRSVVQAWVDRRTRRSGARLAASATHRPTGLCRLPP